MARSRAVAKKQSASSALLQFVGPADIFSRMQQLSDSIARRAYEIFESKGRIFGRDLEDWVQAESELLQPVPIEMEQSRDDLVIRAEVPGFTAKDLDVCLESHRLTIAGKRETTEEHQDGETVHTEQRSDHVLRIVDLPIAVDAGKAAATLKDGVLELKMPKAAPDRNIRMESTQAELSAH